MLKDEEIYQRYRDFVRKSNENPDLALGSPMSFEEFLGVIGKSVAARLEFERLTTRGFEDVNQTSQERFRLLYDAIQRGTLELDGTDYDDYLDENAYSDSNT